MCTEHRPILKGVGVKSYRLDTQRLFAFLSYVLAFSTGCALDPGPFPGIGWLSVLDVISWSMATHGPGYLLHRGVSGDALRGGLRLEVTQSGTSGRVVRWRAT